MQLIIIACTVAALLILAVGGYLHMLDRDRSRWPICPKCKCPTHPDSMDTVTNLCLECEADDLAAWARRHVRPVAPTLLDRAPDTSVPECRLLADAARADHRLRNGARSA